MKKEFKKDKMLRTNVKITYLTFILAFFVLLYIYRLFELQVIDRFNYQSKGNNISRIGDVIDPDRGNIFDRNGNPIAISQKIDSLYLLPVTSEINAKKAENMIKDEKRFNSLSNSEKQRYTKLTSIPTYKDEQIEKLSKILNIKSSEIYSMIENEEEGFIYRALNKSQKSQIESLGINYVRFISVNERYYPNNELASNAIGFVEQGEAKYGLEKYYDKVLSGVSGYREFYKALHGTEIPYSGNENFEETEANNIVTTIDIQLQNILYNRLKDAIISTRSMSATAILMNPNNGEVLAMQSFPTFNPNKPRDFSSEIDKIFLSNLEEKDHTDYLFNKWNNKAVSMEYDPGSVYKTITAAIALEADNSIKDKIYQDEGYYELAPGVIIRSWRYWDPHGPQNLREGFMNSSNPVFVQVAKDIGKEKYIEYGQAFKFGKKTEIDLPNEITGFYPENSDISDIDFGTMSYGHYINVSPIQILSALNSVVNGGKYYKPHMVKSIVNDKNEVKFDLSEEYSSKTISESTSKEIREYLEYTADSYGLNTEELKFGAKTGTTEKYKTESIFKNINDTIQTVYTSIFVTYPSDAPKYSLLIVLDEPLTNSLAADTAKPVAKEIMYDVAAYDMGKPVDVKSDELLIKVPNIIGMSFEEASIELEKLNLLSKTSQKIGRYHIINGQSPSEDNLVEKNTPISLKFDNKIKVPNLINKNIDEVVKILEINNIKFSIEGNGTKVLSLSYNEGDIISEDENIIIKTEE